MTVLKLCEHRGDKLGQTCGPNDTTLNSDLLLQESLKPERFLWPTMSSVQHVTYYATGTPSCHFSSKALKPSSPAGLSITSLPICTAKLPLLTEVWGPEWGGKPEGLLVGEGLEGAEEAFARLF